MLGIMIGTADRMIMVTAAMATLRVTLVVSDWCDDG